MKPREAFKLKLRVLKRLRRKDTVLMVAIAERIKTSTVKEIAKQHHFNP